MATPVLQLSRSQILAFRRAVGSLDVRMPWGKRSLRRAAWAGLQDSMPRAAVLSVHARVERTGPSAWEDPAFVQVWGPRYSVFVVSTHDVAVFTLGRLPDDPKARHRAYDLANRLHDLLDGEMVPFADAGRALGGHPNIVRYATTTGRVRIRWDGARRPTIWTVDPPDVEPHDARRELARRFLHVFGPGTPQSFATWAGIREPEAVTTFQELGRSLVDVSTPIGPAWLLRRDIDAVRAAAPEHSIRLLPSGDAYYLLQGDDRELLVPEAAHRDLLWTSRVWPGAILADGEIVGTWRRSKNVVTIDPWSPLSKRARNAISAEAASFPLPGEDGAVQVRATGP